MHHFSQIIFALLLTTLAMSCSQPNESQNYVPVKSENFQVTHDGKPVRLYTLKNDKDMVVQITNYGGKIVSILVPDKHGNLGDVNLGYESADAYINGIASLGATMGRYANRIANAQFTLNDSTYQLAKNNGEHSIHGGNKGFRFRVWDANQIDGQTLELSYLSEDGEEGYPGNLQVKVVFTVTNENELKLEYTASTDKPTVMNLTNHAFFNLAGEGNESVHDHILYVNADKFTVVDEDAIPTGEIRSVEGTPLDFTEPTRIGDRIDADYQQLEFVGGYDHNYVIDKAEGELALAARLSEPTSGRVMEVYTTEPGIQVYTANSLKSTDTGKGGKVYGSQSSVCLETQHFPDSPHHDNFPSTVLNPDETYQSTTVYKFSVEE